MACAAALRGGFTHPISERQMGEFACCAVSRRRKPESSVPPFPPNARRWETSLTTPSPPLSSIHSPVQMWKCWSGRITSTPFLPDPRVTSFRLWERVGGGGVGLNPGTHPLTFRHFADRHGTFRNMPPSFPVKLSSCSTHGSMSICFHFPFPRPSCCRPPPLLLCRSCKAEWHMDSFEKMMFTPSRRLGPGTRCSFPTNLLLHSSRRPHPQRQPQSNIPDGCSFGLLRIPGSFIFLLKNKNKSGN